MPTVVLNPYDPQLQEQLKALRDQQPAAAPPPPRPNGVPFTPELARRIEHMTASGAGVSAVDLERTILGTNDLLPINYLQRGVLAARSVARLHIGDAFGQTWWGTGFMVSPRLLLTNHHVIDTLQAAQHTTVEFGFETGVDGRPLRSVLFACEPQAAFLTSPELDFTLVAVAERSEDGARLLSDFGFLRLEPQINKVTNLEFVTIIQHPEGKEKYIALRENKVVKIGDLPGIAKDDLIWYVSDTEQGSSGSPVFNDQWQVVALHHRAVPELREQNGALEYRLLDGTWEQLERIGTRVRDQISWLANEGIRVSKIIARTGDLHMQAGAQASPLIQGLLDYALGVRAFDGVAPRASVNVVGGATAPEAVGLIAPAPVSANGTFAALERTQAPRRKVRPLGFYAGRQGYDPDFLGVPLALPQLTAQARRFGQPAPVRDATDNVLRYTHFSVVLNQDRRLAFFTAVNIDGARLLDVPRDDSWYYDPRVALEHQVGDELYSNEPQNWFDRGHLVRRRDPIWGDQAAATLANQDSFHFTNAAPQHWRFNQSDELWQGLENFILFNTEAEDVRASVFTGPIFQDDDLLHRGIYIPQFFWKVVAVRDQTGKLFASAYVVGQQRQAQNIPFEALPVGPFRSFQISIARLEQRSGLAFPDALRAADVFGPERADRPLRGLADIIHPRR